MNTIRRYPLTVLLTMAIVVLSLMPTQSFPETDFRMADKFVHLLMYFMLACVIWWEHWRATRKKPTRAFCAWAVVIPASLGILMELAQAYLTTYRGGDWADAVANSLGAMLALPVGLLFTNHFSERDKHSPTRFSQREGDTVTLRGRASPRDLKSFEYHNENLSNKSSQ